MANNIGDVNYRDCNNQKYKTRVQTEKSINSLFRRNILTREQANKLLDLYLSGEVSFGDDGLTAEEAQNFSIENYKEIEDNLAGNLPRRTKTAYIIQPNDSPLIIAQKLGFTGDEAKEFAAKLSQIKTPFKTNISKKTTLERISALQIAHNPLIAGEGQMNTPQTITIRAFQTSTN